MASIHLPIHGIYSVGPVGAFSTMNLRILHDSAHATALRLLDIVKPCLREEECHDAYLEFYRVVRDGLEAYEEHRRRTESRLRPAGS